MKRGRGAEDVLWVRVKAMNMEHWTDQSPWSRTKRTMIEAGDGRRGRTVSGLSEACGTNNNNGNGNNNNGSQHRDTHTHRDRQSEREREGDSERGARQMPPLALKRPKRK